jgi:plasmid maintenance system antidote protein VapI
MKTKQGPKVSDQLRQAVLAGPISRRQIALRLDIDEGQLSRFVNGKGGLSQENSDRLCAFLGLELRPVEGPRAKKGG